MIPDHQISSMEFHSNLDQFIYLETVDSTNLEIQRRRKALSGSNVLLISDEQTAGKGQHGRQWESKAGKGLWATLFLGQRKQLDHDLQLLSLYTGIIMRQAIANLSGIEASLKWPNDIMINSRKCGGILTEIQWSGSTPSSAIIGLGVNLFHRQNDFSSNIGISATSLQQEGWASPDRDMLAKAFINDFFDQITLLDQQERLADKWNKEAWKMNAEVLWKNDTVFSQGIFKGVNSKGEAAVLTGGSLTHFNSGEIQWSEPG